MVDADSALLLIAEGTVFESVPGLECLVDAPEEEEKDRPDDKDESDAGTKDRQQVVEADDQQKDKGDRNRQCQDAK